MKILNFKKNVTEIVILSSFVILLTTVSCTNQNELAPDVLTFGDIEKEFKFSKPLSDSSKVYILRKFGSIENYRLFVASIKSQKATNEISIAARMDSTNLLFKNQ